MIYPVDSAIQRLNNQGLMSMKVKKEHESVLKLKQQALCILHSDVKKRALKCIEIKATGTLYTAL